MSETLLKCPFCGGEVRFDFTENPYTETFEDVIVCDHCDLIFRGSMDGMEKEDLEMEWNTRKPMERIVERLKEKALGGMGCPQWLPLESVLEIIEEEGQI